MVKNMNTKKVICNICQSNFDAEVIKLGAKEICFQTLCDDCLEKSLERKAQEQAVIERNGRENEFWGSVPPIYRSTDQTKLQAQLRAAIDIYSYGANGLGFAGESGATKTRSMVVLLHRLHSQGKSVMFLKATRLTEVAYQRFDDDHKLKQQAKSEIDRAKSCAALLIDDIGKGRLPASAEELLFDIIDTRMEMGLPLFWTSNAKAQDLHNQFSPDRADPLIRRLAESSQIISV
jgi:DNA replication protein DnaC